MKNLKCLLKDVINGNIVSTRPLVDFYENNKYSGIFLDDYYINGEKYIEFLKWLEECQRDEDENFNYLIEEEVKEEEKLIEFENLIEEWQIHQEEDFNYLIEEDVKEEAISYNKNTDTYTFKEEEDKSYQNYYEDSFDLMRCNYIQNIRKREGILSNIIKILDDIILDINNLNNNMLDKSLASDIYYSFECILDEIEEKKKSQYYYMYQRKDTLVKIENIINKFYNEKYSNIDFDQIYPEELYDEINKLENDYDSLVYHIFEIISLNDNSKQYKKKRISSRYRKKFFKKKSSRYFELLVENKNVMEISQLCGVDEQSVKKFFKRKFSEYKTLKLTKSDEEIIYIWTITIKELETFLIYMIKREDKSKYYININNISEEEKKKIIENYFNKLDKKA